MKLVIALSLVGFTALGLGSGPEEWDPDADEWVEAASFALSPNHTSPDLGQRAWGASAYGFRIGPHSCGAIVDRLDRRGIAVFLSIGLDMTSLDTIGDVRVEFTDRGGERHIMGHDAMAGGGSCLLFRTPDGVPTSEFVAWRVLYDPRSEWVRS